LFQPTATEAQPVPSGAFTTAPKRVADVAGLGELSPALPGNLREAALAGDPAAVYEVASRTLEGRGVPRDPALAVRLFERTAQSGFVPAQARIGNLYEKGQGVTRDLAVARTWYERAGISGNARAMHNLAVLFAEGIDGKPDFAAAQRWFHDAAEAGLRDSQFNLGVLLARGLGTAQDLPQSYKWFALAAAQGDEEAAKKRDEVTSRLSPADLSSAKALLEHWRPRSLDPVANEVPVPAQGWSAMKVPTRRG
jgi:localization factor PodJL